MVKIFFFPKKTREENDFLAKIFLVPTAVVGDFFIKIVKKKISERLEIFGNGQKLVSTAVVEVVEIWNQQNFHQNGKKRIFSKRLQKH